MCDDHIDSIFFLFLQYFCFGHSSQIYAHSPSFHFYAVRKQGLASAKPKRTQTGCKRQTYQNKGFWNSPEF